ncbi:phosphotransferase [Streptomyces sp. NPDC050738]|uniref:phosphotransferase n=1 Tax=Streptomyces sp. NPDC050738 TaxID=3154744 RepID=UPI003432A008
MPGGHVGTSAMVATGQGLVVVKRHSARFGLDRIQLAAEAHRHAALAGLAPQPLTTASGQLTAFVDGTSYLLTEYIEAAEPPTRNDLAQTLAALHAHFECLQPASRCPDFVQLPNPPTAGLERVLKHTTAPAVREAVVWRWDILTKHGLAPRVTSALRHHWIHGDASPDNLLMLRTPARRSFIDFDQVSRFPRPYEIVRAFLATVDTRISPPELRSSFRHYLDAYQVVLPLHAADRAVMIDLYITVQAAETRTFTTPEGEVRRMRDFTHARRQRLTWLIRNRDLLHDTAEEVTA